MVTPVRGRPRARAATRLRPVVALAFAVALALVGTATAQGAETFDRIADRVQALYHAPERVDWDAWRARYRAEADAAPDDDAWQAVMERAFDGLRDRHSRWLGSAGGLGAPWGPPSDRPSGTAPPEPPQVASVPDRASGVVRIVVPSVGPGVAEAVH
ncbi:MAG: hypothetical protein WD336_00810, partial [Trueperaceae bacterium]